MGGNAAPAPRAAAEVAAHLGRANPSMAKDVQMSTPTGDIRAGSVMQDQLSGRIRLCGACAGCVTARNRKPPADRGFRGSDRRRSGDLSIFSRTLYQLSYRAVVAESDRGQG